MSVACAEPPHVQRLCPQHCSLLSFCHSGSKFVHVLPQKPHIHLYCFNLSCEGGLACGYSCHHLCQPRGSAGSMGLVREALWRLRDSLYPSSGSVRGWGLPCVGGNFSFPPYQLLIQSSRASFSCPCPPLRALCRQGGLRSSTWGWRSGSNCSVRQWIPGRTSSGVCCLRLPVL